MAGELPDLTARRWAVLNRLRRAALAHHASVEGRRSFSPFGLGCGVALLAILGGGWTVCAVHIGVTGDGFVEPAPGEGGGPWRAWNLLGLAMLLLPGLAMLVGSAGLVQTRRDVVTRLRRFGERAAQRESWRAALGALSRRWGGLLEADGIGPGVRFLERCYPGCAPSLLLHHQPGNPEARVSLTATVDERPVLIQLVDFPGPGTRVLPPALVLLVAFPMAPPPPLAAGRDATPFRTGAAPRLEDSEAHGELVARGFVVGWGTSGAHATHAGPAQSALDEESLAAAMRALLALCAAAPPAAQPALGPADLPQLHVLGYDAVVDAFLCALRDRDALAALSLAHPLLFPDGPLEPSLEDLDGAIDAANARPTSWKPTNLLTAGDVRRSLDAELERRAPAEIQVHLSLLGERWTVMGYVVAGTRVLGTEMEDTG